MDKLKAELIKADIEEYKRKISYCDNFIKEFTRKKEMWQRRLNKRRLK